MGAMFGGITPGMSAQQVAQQQLASQGISSLDQQSQEILPMQNIAVGNVPMATANNFPPQAQKAAAGIYGTEEQRGLFQKPKPLINL
jgi:hypothetical protein